MKSTLTIKQNTVKHEIVQLRAINIGERVYFFISIKIKKIYIILYLYITLYLSICN